MTTLYDKLLADWPADVPFERVVRQRLLLLDDLIKRGTTWSAIAGAFARAGITQRSGRPLSSRQLNTVYRRSKKKATVPHPIVPVETMQATSLQLRSIARRPPLSTGLAGRLEEARNLVKSRTSEYDE